jgi:Helix-turn-helix domain/SseB protein N-terminal domain
MNVTATGMSGDRVFRAGASDMARLRTFVRQIDSATPTSLLLDNDVTIPMPVAVVGALRRIATCMAIGQALVIDPYDEVLTTQEAADLLHVSRPHLIAQLLKAPDEENDRKDGIPFYWAGRHRRIRLSDVESFIARRSETMPEDVRPEKLKQIAGALKQEVMFDARVAPLEAAIRAQATVGESQIREALENCDIYALGEPVTRPGISHESSESDLLHFTIDDPSGQEVVMLPVFTRLEPMRDALLRNPDWQALSVLQIGGRDLLNHVDEEVIIVVNPWSDLEFQLPRRADIKPRAAHAAVGVARTEPMAPVDFRPVDATKEAVTRVVPAGELALAVAAR